MNAVLEEVNPNAPKVTYSKGGIKRTTSPGRFEVSDGATSVYQQLATLGKSQQWAELAKECEAQILRRPGWYTPYVFAGIAYANLGNASRAIELLEKADRGMANNPDYEDLPKLAKDLLTKLKPQE
jgi:tetratricopeptide (TPR) repeat protein